MSDLTREQLAEWQRLPMPHSPRCLCDACLTRRRWIDDFLPYLITAAERALDSEQAARELAEAREQRLAVSQELEYVEALLNQAGDFDSLDALKEHIRSALADTSIEWGKCDNCEEAERQLAAMAAALAHLQTIYREADAAMVETGLSSRSDTTDYAEQASAILAAYNRERDAALVERICSFIERECLECHTENFTAKFAALWIPTELREKAREGKL